MYISLGTIKGEALQWEEYEVIKGQEDVEVPMKYEGKINGAKITGKTLADDDESNSTFTLEKLPTAPSKGMLIFYNKTRCRLDIK